MGQSSFFSLSGDIHINLLLFAGERIWRWPLTREEHGVLFATLDVMKRGITAS